MNLVRILFLNILFLSVYTPRANACSPAMKHKGSKKDGRIETYFDSQSELDGFENCIFTFSNDEDLTQVKGQQLDFKVTTRNFNNFQRSKIISALSKLKRIINSTQFRDRVLGHRYNNSRSYANNRGLSNLSIYYKIMQGAEILKSIKNKTMDLDLTLYYEDTNVVGYTYPHTNRIWINAKYFNKFSYGSIAGNLTHEWLHKLGFGHDFEVTSRRNYSVPYGIGYIMRSML